MVGLPTTIGKGIQFAGNELGMPSVADAGAGMVQSADVRGQAPGLTLQPEGHGSVLNSIARVTAGSGAFLPGVAAALIPGMQEFAPALFAAGGVGAALESGEDTREAVAAVKGNTPGQANMAGLIDAVPAAVLNAFGGKLFGSLMEATANPLIKAARGMLGQEAPGLAGGIMSDLTGTGGAIMPVLKQLPMTALETAGIIGGQNAAGAAIQQSYGVQGGPTPWDAFKGSLGDSLTTAGLFSGIAMRGRASNNSAAQTRTAILAHPDTDPAVRSQMADQYAQALAQPGTPEAQAASTAFRANAQTAIDNKQALPVNSDLFTPGAIAPPAPPEAPPLLLGQSTPAPMVTFPDGSQSHSQADIDAYVNSFPPSQQDATRSALMAGTLPADHAPTAEPLRLGYSTPDPIVSFPDGSSGPSSHADALIASMPPDQQAPMRARMDALNAGVQNVTTSQGAGPIAVDRAGTATTPEYGTQGKGTVAVRGDGSALPANYVAQEEARIATLPEAEQVPARAAMLGLGSQPAVTPVDVAAHQKEMVDLHEQVKQGLSDAGADVAKPMTRADFASSPAGKRLKGQALSKAYDAYVVSPETQQGLMRTDALTYDAMAQRHAVEDVAPAEGANPLVEAKAPEAPFNSQLGDKLTDALKQSQVDTQYKQYMAQRASDKAAQDQATHSRTKGSMAAAAADAAYRQHSDALDAVHGQVNDALRAGGETPDLITSEDPAEQEKTMRGNADKFDAMQQAAKDATDQAAAASSAKNASEQQRRRVAGAKIDATEQIRNAPEESAPINTQLSDNLRNAAKQREIDRRFATVDAAADAAKQRDMEKGFASNASARADAAEPDANAPKGKIELGADIEAVDAGFKGQPKGEATLTARVKALGIPDMKTHAEQIEALRVKTEAMDAAAKGKAPSEVRDRMGALLKKWQDDAKPVEEAKPVGEASPVEAQPEPVAAPDTTGFETGLQPAAAREVISELPENTGTKSTPARVSDAIDRLNATIVKLRGRPGDGTVLTPLEAQRLKDAQEYRKNLAESTHPANRNGEGYVKELLRLSHETDQPYTQKLLDDRLRLRGSPDTPDPAIGAAIDQSNKLSDVLGHIATNSTDPANRALATRYAERLAVMGSEPTVQRGPGDPSDPLNKAGYSRSVNAVTIHPGGETEHAVLHEAGHAAQSAAIDYAASIDKPRNQAEALLKQGYAEVDAVRQKALLAKGAADHYGLDNMHEFMAEANSNPDFQSFLRRQGTQKSWWDRTVDAVRKLLGMKVDERTALAKSMTLNDALFGADHEAADKFQTSMPGAARAVDDTMQLRIKAVDDFMKSVDDKGLFTTMKHGLFRESLGWQTQDYTAARLHSVPEMVRSGMASAADAFRAARDSVRQASEHLDKIFGDYANGVKTMYGAMDALKAKALDRQLGRIGTEASMGGFNFRMNFDDNFKDRPGLDKANKAYIDGIHRDFTQLQRTNPEAAKALERGELVNRKMLITKFAPRLRNVLDARAGIATRLASDLQRMTPDVAQAAQDRVNAVAAKLAALPPEDASNRAQRAALTAQLETAQQQLPANRIAAAQSEVDLAANHGPGLDFMRKDVREAKNPDNKVHYDGGAAVLGQRITAMFSDARNLPAGTPLRDHMAEMEKEYTAQMANPYFSAGRTGNFFVSMGFKNMDAATQAKLQAELHGTNKELGNLLDPTNNRAFFRVETQDQAQGLHDKMVAALGADHLAENTAAWGKLGDKSMISTHGVSPAISSMLGDIDTMVDHTPGLSPEQGQQMKATLQRSMLSLLPETSVRAAKMQRRGIPGYEATFLDNFTNRAAGAVQDTANLYGSRAYTGAIQQMGDAVKTMNSSPAYSGDGRVRAQAVADEFNKRYANGMNSFDNSIVNTINSIGSTFYLMASPAYLIRTSAQPWHRGLPAMGSRYGFASSAAAIGKAQFDASKIFHETLKGGYQDGKMRGLLNATISAKDSGLTAGEQQFIMELHDRGELNLGMSGQLAAANIRGSQRAQDATRLAGLTAQIAEMHGRTSVGLAAFRLAEKGKPGIDQQGRMANIDYAQTLMRNAMDNFDSNNTARRIGKFGFAGPVTPLFTQFMNYNLQTMQQITRTVQDGFMNKDPSAAGLQRSAEAKKEFGGLMATTAMISGALGLPFVNAFAGVYNMLTRDDDNPADIRIEARNFLARTLGPQGGEIASHGLGGAINMDTSTFGLENLLPGSEFLADRRLLQDKMESQSQQLLGPALNGGLSLMTGLSKISDGYWIKGIEVMLPSGLKAPYKAAEMSNRGYTDAKGNPIQVGDTKAGQPVGAWDTGLQAAGFRTAEKASTDEFHNYAVTQEQLLQHRTQVITDHFYKASLPGHEDEMPAAMQEMVRFNAANPTTPIRGASLADVMKTHAQTNALGGVNRKYFPSLGPQMDFLGRQPSGGGMPAGQ
jgi:hypothetical protein